MYRCKSCGAPTRPNVDGDIRYDASKPLHEIARLRAALKGLMDALAANDEDGLTEFAEPMTAARAQLKAPSLWATIKRGISGEVSPEENAEIEKLAGEW